MSYDNWSRDHNIDLMTKLDFRSSSNENLLQIKSSSVCLSVRHRTHSHMHVVFSGAVGDEWHSRWWSKQVSGDG